jgi:hypothetical protein
MEHKTLEQIQRVAELYPDEAGPIPVSKRDRLKRWAELLERQANRNLNTLYMTEYVGPESLDSMRCDGSPISCAMKAWTRSRRGLASSDMDRS